LAARRAGFGSPALYVARKEAMEAMVSGLVRPQPGNAAAAAPSSPSLPGSDEGRAGTWDRLHCQEYRLCLSLVSVEPTWQGLVTGLQKGRCTINFSSLSKYTSVYHPFCPSLPFALICRPRSGPHVLGSSSSSGFRSLARLCLLPRRVRPRSRPQATPALVQHGEHQRRCQMVPEARATATPAGSPTP